MLTYNEATKGLWTNTKLPSLQGSCAFARIGDQVLRSSNELATALQMPRSSVPSPEVHDYDLIYPESEAIKSEEAVTAVLYGAIGTKGFWQMHQLLFEQARKKRAGGKSQSIGVISSSCGKTSTLESSIVLSFFLLGLLTLSLTLLLLQWHHSCSSVYTRSML